MRKTIVLLVLASLIVLGLCFAVFYKQNNKVNYITLYGNVDIRQVDLGFRVLGLVEHMPFEEGDLVTRGMLMGKLDKQPFLDEVRQAQANVFGIQFNLKNAEELVQRRKDIVSQGAIAIEDYHNAITSRDVFKANLKQAQAALGVALKNLQDTEVYAPNDGTILTRIREPGSIVNPGEPIYTLSLLTPVWIRAFIQEPELGLIFPGMPAEIYTDTPGGKVYQGHIGFISPVAEFTPKTVETTHLRTDLVYRLRVIADNPDEGLRQGMPVTVRLLLPKPRILNSDQK